MALSLNNFHQQQQETVWAETEAKCQRAPPKPQ